MIFKEKQNRILSVTVKVLNNYDNYKLKDMDKEDKNMKYAAKAWKETEGASLRNFNEQAQVDSVNGALALRPQIETIIDQIWEEGFDGIYFIGIGGTYASSMQVEVYMRGRSKLPIYVENAAEFLTTGNKRFTEKSVVIYSSVSGNTKEMVQLVDRVHEIGARVFAFIDTPNSILTQPDKQDYLILYPMNEQLKFYMTANYLMYKNGEFDEYDRYNKEMETYLADALVQVEKDSDEWAYEYAKNKVAFLKEHKDLPHYFIGSGNQYGATYSYAMCYWEEQMWIRTKSISCQEFFHGMQEIIVNDPDLYHTICSFFDREIPERSYLIRLYDDAGYPLGKLYSTQTAIENALKERVWLKHGGYLVIQVTEALTVVDVNSGKSIKKSKNTPDALKLNLEAAQETARQIRLRNLSGIILVDFVNMDDPEMEETLFQEFRFYLTKDPIQTTLVDITALGLAEVTRKKVRKPLYEMITV